MKAVLSWLLLAGLGVPAGAAAPPRTIPIDRSVAWTSEQRSPSHYVAGPFRITIAPRRDAQDPEMATPVVTVSAEGSAPVTLEGELAGPAFESRLGLGRFDANRLFLSFQSYSGGAHCCTRVQVVLAEPDGLRVHDLGAWDGGVVEAMPSDLDGDGQVDFAFVDNRFLYAFASYADSFAPPQILNIERGAVIDVSDRAGFRPLFEEAWGQSRRACLDPGEGPPNGACAAFVAAAARLGRFDAAWAEMLGAYDRTSDWGLEGPCRVEASDGLCPAGQETRFASFPDALRHFLAEAGYIAPPPEDEAQGPSTKPPPRL